VLCWHVCAQQRVLQKDSQHDGCYDGNHRNTEGLSKTSGQTAARVHVSGNFPTTVWRALYR
jgi:hypothetical protein